MQRLGLGFIYYSVVCSHNAGHNPLKGLCWGQIGLSHTIGTDNKTDKGQGKQGNSWEMQRALDNLPSTTANYSLLERAAFTWDILEIKGLRSDIQKSDLTKMHEDARQIKFVTCQSLAAVHQTWNTSFVFTTCILLSADTTVWKHSRSTNNSIFILCIQTTIKTKFEGSYIIHVCHLLPRVHSHDMSISN